MISVTEKSIELVIEAEDGVEKIGEGTHIRVPVELSRLDERVRQKLAVVGK